jgi:hypothetical protein
VTVVSSVKKFLVFYGITKFITLFNNSSKLDPLPSHMKLVHHTNCANDQTHQILYLRTLLEQYSHSRCRINARSYVFHRITVRWKTKVNSESCHGFSGLQTSGGSSGGKKIIFKGSFTEEEFENTELSQWVKLFSQCTYRNSELNVQRNWENLVNFKHCQ